MKTLLRKRFTWLVVLTALAVNTAMAQNHHTATPVEPGSKGNLPSMPARPAEAEPGYFGGLELDHQTASGVILNGYYTYEGWLRFPYPKEYGANYYTLQYRQTGTTDWKTWTNSNDEPYYFEGDNACPSLDYMETDFRLTIVDGPMEGYISNIVTVNYPEVKKCRVRSYPIFTENQLVGHKLRLPYFGVERHDYPNSNQTTEFNVEDGYYRYKWYRRNPNSGEMQLIEGVNDREYTPTTEDVGYQIVLSVSGDDEHVSVQSTFNFQLIQLPLECSVEYMDQTGFVLNSAYVLPNPEKDLLISEDWSEENLKPFAEGSLTTLKPGQYSVEMDKEKFDGALLGYSDNRIKVSFVYSQPKYDEEGYPIEGEYEPWYREAQLMYDRYMVPFTVNAMFNNELVSTTFDVIGKNRLGEIATVATVTSDKLEENVASFEVFQGKYYVRARKTEGTMETYYPNVQLWSEAKQIEPEPMSWEEDWKPTSVSIAMQAAPAPLTGIGVIEGTVVLNEPAAAGTRGDNEAETETCRVYLKAKDAEIIAQTETDANGKFRFENVPFGDYQVLLDVEGRSMKSVQEVAVTEDKPEVAELDYVITENEIVTKEEYIASITTEPIKIGNSGKATYTTSKALDFSSFDDLKAYVATGYESNGTIWLTRISQVPANTPVLIKGEADKTYEVPVMDQCKVFFENMFQGSADEDLTISTTTADGKYKNFYMAGGQFKPASESQTIKAGKCYLQVPASFKAAAAGEDQTVKIAESGKSSYAPPVDVDLTEVEGLKAYAATGYDAASSTIWLTRINKIQAGEGVILKGEAGKEYTLPSAATQAYYGNMFVGNIGSKITINETSDDGEWTNFYLASGSFKKVSGTREIGTNKSYLQLPTSLLVSSARGRNSTIAEEWLMEELETEAMFLGSIGGDDEDGTTKIDTIGNESAQPNVYYNLQGQRVDNPRKGIYIRNGKKYVVK